MNVVLDVLASKANIARYQSLLTREWTGRTLSEASFPCCGRRWPDPRTCGTCPFRDVLEPEPRKPPR